MLTNVLSFASTIILARLLAPADFGLVAIAATAVAVVASLTELSLAQALVQRQHLEEEHYHSAWTLNLLRAATLAVLIGVAAQPVAMLYDDPRLLWLLLVLGASTLISGLTNPKLINFSRDLVFWQQATLALSQALAGFAVGLVVALVWQSYWALIGALVANQLCGLLLSYLFVPYRPRLDLSKGRELLTFSGWLTLGQAVNTLNWRADQLVIGFFLGNTNLGYYSVGDRLAVLPTREATAPLSQVLFPSFSRIRHDAGRLRQAYLRAQSSLSALALPAGFGFALIAEPLVVLTMGQKWEPAVLVIQVLAGVFALQTLTSTVQPLAMSLGETRSLFRRDMVILAIRLPLVLAGMLLSGLPGILAARCVSGLTGMAINMTMVRRLLGLRVGDQIKSNWRSLLGTVIMIAATLAVRSALGRGDSPSELAAHIALLVLTGLFSYGTAVVLLWHLAGRPDGPEQEARDFLANRHRAFRPVRSGNEQ